MRRTSQRNTKVRTSFKRHMWPPTKMHTASLTPFPGTVFHALSHCRIIGCWKITKQLNKQALGTKWIPSNETARIPVLENGTISCILVGDHFYLWKVVTVCLCPCATYISICCLISGIFWKRRSWHWRLPRCRIAKRVPSTPTDRPPDLGVDRDGEPLKGHTFQEQHTIHKIRLFRHIQVQPIHFFFNC